MNIWSAGCGLDLYNLKASHGRKCRLGFTRKGPNPLATREYEVGGPLYDAPALISVTADVG